MNACEDMTSIRNTYGRTCMKLYMQTARLMQAAWRLYMASEQSRASP